MGVGCEAPHIRPISPIFPGVFRTLLIFYASPYAALQGGLVSGIPVSSLGEEALFLFDEG